MNDITLRIQQKKKYHSSEVLFFVGHCNQTNLLADKSETEHVDHIYSINTKRINIGYQG